MPQIFTSSSAANSRKLPKKQKLILPGIKGSGSLPLILMFEISMIGLRGLIWIRSLRFLW